MNDSCPFRTALAGAAPRKRCFFYATGSDVIIGEPMDKSRRRKNRRLLKNQIKKAFSKRSFVKSPVAAMQPRWQSSSWSDNRTKKHLERGAFFYATECLLTQKVKLSTCTLR